MKPYSKIIINLVAVLILSLSSIVHADGFFSRLLGSGKHSSFKQMLSHVPADTPYLVANQKPVPEDVLEFQLARSRQMLEIFIRSVGDIQATLETSNSVIKPEKSSKLESIKEPTKEPDTGSETDASGAFIKALFEDLGSRLDAKKITETGLSTKGSNVIYAMNTIPVLRIAIDDKDKLMAMLKRAETKSDYKLELEKCNDADCFLSKDPASETLLAAVILNDQVAISVFPSDKKEQMLDHLSGKTTPKNSYKEKDWESFLSRNKYSGYGDGFVNLLALFEKMKPQILQQANKQANNGGTSEACLAVAKQHLENMPELLFGTQALQKQGMDYELVLKTSPHVSAVLQTIANKKNIAKRAKDPIFDLGLNINFIKLRDALTQYTTFLADSAQKNKCGNIDPMQIRKATGGIMMAMNMGLTQFKSIYLAINDVELNDKMQPEKVDIYASIGSEDPAGLVGMLAMLNPSLATLKLPEDGSAVNVPAKLIPSRGVAVPPIALSRGDKTLNVMLGNAKPALRDYEDGAPEILSFSLDGKRYYQKMAQIMESLPDTQMKMNPSKNVKKLNNPPAKQEREKQHNIQFDTQKKDMIDMIRSMGKIMGHFNEQIRADERGLIVDYQIRF